jgi:hypothetical protein
MVEVRPDLWPLLDRGAPVSPVWETAAFADEMRSWCSGVLDRDVQLEVQKIRGWSAVWGVTDGREVWFAKQNCPGQLFEATLLDVLSRLSDRVVPVTAVDPERGFLLTPDQGSVLADTDGDPVEQSCAVAREGALLQRELAPHLAQLEGAGLLRLGPAEATTYVATRTEQYAALAEGDPRRLDADAAARLRTRLPEVEAWADRLLRLGLPLTLVHNDLHGHNVFPAGGRMRFFDFGDAVLGDPLSVLLVVVRSLMFRLECEPDDPRLTRVSEAALEPWSDLASLADLRQALDAGLQLGKLARAESWARCLRNLTDAETAAFGDAGTYWLQAIEAPALQTE